MKKTWKKTDLVLLGILAVLLAASLCCTFCLLNATESEFTVTNQKAELYDATRIPEIKAGGSININTADAQLLNTLPGIGPTLARRIIEHRETYGEFVHPAILTAVTGIGEKTYEKMAPYITVKEVPVLDEP